MAKPKKKKLEPAEADQITPDICVVCGQTIKVSIYKGSGVCCDDHRKVRDGNDPSVAVF